MENIIWWLIGVIIGVLVTRLYDYLMSATDIVCEDCIDKYKNTQTYFKETDKMFARFEKIIESKDEQLRSLWEIIDEKDKRYDNAIEHFLQEDNLIDKEHKATNVSSFTKSPVKKKSKYTQKKVTVIDSCYARLNWNTYTAKLYTSTTWEKRCKLKHKGVSYDIYQENTK